MNKPQVPETTLNRLLSDCSIYNLTVKQAVEYVDAYTGVRYSEDHVKKLMQEFNKEGYIDEWLRDYTRIGYLIQQRESLDSMVNLKNVLMNKLYVLTKKEDCKITDLTSISHALVGVDIRIEELRLGTPIIALIKKKLDEKDKEIQHLRDKK